MTVARRRRRRNPFDDVLMLRDAVIETGKIVFRAVPSVKRQNLLDRLKKIAADTEAKIARARDPARLRAGMLKLAAVHALIKAAPAKRRRAAR